MPTGVRAEPRDRSRVVCQRCHARKVKCDLINQLERGGKCTNCEKRFERCHRRHHKQNKDDGRHSQAQAERRRQDAIALQQLSPETSSASAELHSASQSSPDMTSTGGVGYVGELSVMSNQQLQPEPPNDRTPVGSIMRSHETLALAATQADQLPPQPVIDALAGIYFQHLYHRMPVVNHSDLATPGRSTLLLQSLCLAGSILRHPRNAHESAFIQRERFYANAKTLFYTNHEQDPMAVLKSMCLLTTWNVTPPAVITFDCSWSWLGLALRLALQMGLHKEATYDKRTDPGTARRVAWFLYAQDKLHAACFGRPQMMRDDDFDLALPTASDFEPSESGRARLFISFTELAAILGRISVLQNKELPQASQDILSVLTRLREWAGKIHAEFQGFDEHGDLIYQKEWFEVLLWYFTCLVTFFHVQGLFFHPSVASTVSLVASSCAIRLYREMDYRDDVNYLTAIYNWSMMVVSLPQLNDMARRQHSIMIEEDSVDAGGSPSSEELDALLEIVANRTVKFPGAQALVVQLNDLRKQAQLGVTDSVEPGAPAADNGSYLTISQVRDFFPFPDSFAPRMDLLRTLESEDYLDELGGFPEWSFETFMNMENMDAFL